MASSDGTVTPTAIFGAPRVIAQGAPLLPVPQRTSSRNTQYWLLR